MEKIVVLVTLLLVGATWLFYQLVVALEPEQ